MAINMAVIGTGYVGLVSGVCFAEKGNHVICVDQDSNKISMLNNNQSPIYEPGIEEYIKRNMLSNRLEFSTNVTYAVQQSDVVVISVGTPSLLNGEVDLHFILQAAEEIGRAINGYKIIMTKSTVPVGTNTWIRTIINEQTAYPFDIVSVPEFLREGSAIHDTLNPDRIIIGLDNPELEVQMRTLHSGFTDQIYMTTIRSAEMIKYASNAFLATKISFINEISNICEKVGADVTEVANGMGMDNRIGPAFLNAGIGYGGSCFPKDTNALIQIAGNVDYEFKLLKSVVEVNKAQRAKIITKLEESLGPLLGLVVTLWGLSFKPGTDDVRDAPSLEIAEILIHRGVRLKLYDPIAADNFKKNLDHPNIQWCENAYEAAEGSDAVCLLTEWQVFKDIQLQKVASIMNTPVRIDGRNVYSQKQIEGTGFNYYSVGRPITINNPVMSETKII